MPAPVPAGFTRGSILFLGSCQSKQSEDLLLQHFWEEAGAYGSRIVLLPADEESATLARRYADIFTRWESDSVELILINSREAALRATNLERIESATAILLLGENPVWLASILGGTPLAQAIRRANARGKAVGGYGRAAALLCEHMIAYETDTGEDRNPFLRRHLIHFAPGLGITNRAVIDVTPAESSAAMNRLARLLHAVAYNPFLVGVGLEVDTGAVIYADNTLEIFGQNSALVVDGAEMSHTDIHEFRRSTPLSLLGTRVHVLGAKYTFNLQERTAHPPAASDIPDRGVPDEMGECV
jgi:cyanophycinase